MNGIMPKLSVTNPRTSAPQVFRPWNCDAARFAEFVIVQARVNRVKITEAARAEAVAKQALYEHQRRAWLKLWREHYGFDDQPHILDPQRITTATLLLFR
jgi:hypothetical protein